MFGDDFCGLAKKMLDFLCNFVYQDNAVWHGLLLFRGIAQLVERRSPKPNVVSSNLTAPANQDEDAKKRLFSL